MKARCTRVLSHAHGVFLFLCVVTTLAVADGGLSRRHLFVHVRGDTTERYLLPLFSYLEKSLPHSLTSQGLILVSEAQADFILTISIQKIDQRALVRTILVDKKDGAIIHASQRLVYPGLLAQLYLEEMLQQVLAVIQHTQSRFIIAGPIEYNLEFESPEDGLELWMGKGPGRVLLGRIENGILKAPYYPFDREAILTLSAEKEGRWPREVPVTLGPEPRRIFVDRLNVKSQHQAFVVLSPTRMGLRGGYRFFPLADTFMIGGDFSFWIQYPPQPNAVPVYHQELRAATGAYLFFPEDNWLRFLVGLGSSWFFTWIPSDLAFLVSNNFSIEPLWFALEWNQSWYTLFFEVRAVNALEFSDLFPEKFLGLWVGLGGAIKW